MKIYLITIEDRHYDPEHHAFTSSEDATDFAQAYVDEIDSPETSIRDVKGYLFCASMGEDGPSISVEELELKGGDELAEKAWKYDQLCK